MIRSGFDIEPFKFRGMPPPTISPRRLRQRRRFGLYQFETLDLESPTMPTLRMGSRGSAVIDLQTRLAGAGFSPGPVDGIFGPRTDGAVRSFQGARGLKVDGIVGPLTWGELLGTTTAPQPAPGTGSPSPAPGSGSMPAAWSNGPVNPPTWHPPVISQSSIECGSKLIPVGLQPESVSQGWTARTQKVASFISGPPFNWRSDIDGRADRIVRAPSSNHYCGRAIDAFPPGAKYGRAVTGNALREGWRLANWAAHNAQAQNISEVIFFDRIWTVARCDEGWRPYTNSAGSTITLQHRDHVHISVY